MKAKVEIFRKDAERVLQSQYDEKVNLDIVFESGLLSIPTEDQASMIKMLEDESKWFLIYEADEEGNVTSAKLTWENEIPHFKTGETTLRLDGTHHSIIFDLIREGYKEILSPIYKIGMYKAGQSFAKSVFRGTLEEVEKEFKYMFEHTEFGEGDCPPNDAESAWIYKHFSEDTNHVAVYECETEEDSCINAGVGSLKSNRM